jgi:hypothetical protein
MLAVSGIVWALCLAIILSATNATVGSVKGALIAGFVLWIITTIAGAFVGGAVAGYLPGNPRRVISVAHGLLAWGLAFVVSGWFTLAMVRGTLRTATEVLTTTTSAVVQSAGSAVGGAAGATASLDQKALSVLESLGYTRSEATGMVSNARDGLQQILRGQGPEAQQIQTGAAKAATQARGALDTMIGWTAGYVWLWWATWMLAGLAAMGGAAMVLDRTRRVAERERVSGSEPLQIPTFRPARTMP